jgi:hypothetical protein
MDWIRLNAFQRIMRMWDQVHPYSGGQAIRVPGRVDPSLWRSAFVSMLSELGLGHVRLRGADYAHRAVDPAQIAQDLAAGTAGAEPGSFFAAQLDQPFPDDAFCPFRPFVLHEGNSSIIGLFYRHFVADSVSIRLLLREWFLRVYAPDRARRTPMPVARKGFWHYFGPDASGWNVGEAVGATLRFRTRFSRVRGVIEKPDAKLAVDVSLHRLPEGLIDAIRARARAQGATVNDVFLAALARTCDELGVTPRLPTRDEIALGTIVDLRRLQGRPLGETFGMFLGFTTIVLRGSALRDPDLLLRRVIEQNDGLRRTCAPQMSLLRIAAANVEAALTSPQGWADKYRKAMPMSAGISNVNMNDSWAAEFHPDPILEYIRISPLGPILPMVLATTTLGREFHVVFTRRRDLFPAPLARRAIELFEREIRRYS